MRAFVRPRKTLGLKRVDAETGVYEFPDDTTLGIERVGPKHREDGELAGRLLAVSFKVADTGRAYRRLASK